MSIRQEIEEYIDGVLSGDVVAGQWIRKYIERHVHDLEHGHERGLYFDWHYAYHIIFFSRLCVHYQGTCPGTNFEPVPWQKTLLAILFGWRRADGTRRFRYLYLEIGRKNGKTFLSAVIAKYMTCADGEMGAEVYSVATKKEQARKCHGDAENIIKSSPLLKNEFRILRHNITHEKSLSFFRPLSSDHNKMDSLNIHCVVCDELHAWRNRLLWDVITTSFGSRLQWMVVVTTTAGYDRATTCWDQHVHTKKILTRKVEDDSYLGIIFSLDNESEIESEAAWPKANPNYGVSVVKDTIREAVNRAKSIPSQLNNILRLYFNIWTQSEFRWLRPDHWAACTGEFQEKDLYGRTCYAGLDLSTSNDISSLVLMFPPVEPNEPYKVLCRCWCPEDKVQQRTINDSVPYDIFVRSGELIPTPGGVVDYNHIINKIKSDKDVFDISELRYDRWRATEVVEAVDDMGIESIGFGQGFGSMTGPSIELERLVIAGMLAHGGNAVLSWMSQNVIVVYDAAGNIKPDKSKSSEKIDGIVALIMATAGAVADGGGSLYDDKNFPWDE